MSGSRSGYGVCRYFNGDYYEGTWADGVRNGSGMQQCMDGSNYVGQYRDAKRDGCGVYTFHNGDCYLGTYRADLPNGIGVYLFEKGQKYMGEWDNGKKHGMCARWHSVPALMYLQPASRSTRTQSTHGMSQLRCSDIDHDNVAVT